jgi:hypothetical protein
MKRNRRIKAFKITRFIVAVIMVSAVLLFIESCNRNENNVEELNSDEVQYVPGRRNIQQLLAIAVDKSFNNKLGQQSSTKSYVANTGRYQPVAETDPVRISYPYDYIKVYDVVKFSCAGVKNPLVQAICGDGEIEVFIASFALLMETDEEETEEEKTHLKSSNADEAVLRSMMMGEPMIVFKNDLGIYSCIANSAGIIDLTDYYLGCYTEFSSHKYLSDKALEKDMTYPVFQYIVTLTNGKVTLKTTSIDNGYITYDSEIPLYNWQTVSPQELFSLVDLSNNILEVSLQCEVIGVSENYFIVKTDSDSNIETVYYDEYTEFSVGGRSATSADISAGAVITVTFGKLYESYNPKSVIANKIFY